MKKVSYTPGPHLADIYLMLKAEQADLALKEEALKAAMVKMGQEVIEGEIARVTISEVEGRVSYDKTKLEAMFSKSALFSALKQGNPSVRFAVKARQGNEQIAA